MTKEQALAILESVTGASQLTRQQHMAVLEALNTLRGGPLKPPSTDEIKNANGGG